VTGEPIEALQVELQWENDWWKCDWFWILV